MGTCFLTFVLIPTHFLNLKFILLLVSLLFMVYYSILFLQTFGKMVIKVLKGSFFTILPLGLEFSIVRNTCAMPTLIVHYDRDMARCYGRLLLV